MRDIFIIDGVKGVKVNLPSDGYSEVFTIGRYTVQAIILADGYTFHIFRNDELKAIITNEEWFISKLDGEGQNLVNRLMKIFG